MRSNNQIEFNNYSTASRANITINSSVANFGTGKQQLNLSKDVSEINISPSKIQLHKTKMRPQTGVSGGRKLKPSTKFNSIMNRTNTNMQNSFQMQATITPGDPMMMTPGTKS